MSGQISNNVIRFLEPTQLDSRLELNGRSPRIQSSCRLIALTVQQSEENTGVDRYSDLRIKEAKDFRPIPTEVFTFLKDQYPLFSTLPKPPSIGTSESLTKRMSHRDLRDLFADNWTSANLNYSVAAEVFQAAADLVAEGSLAQDTP